MLLTGRSAGNSTKQSSAGIATVARTSQHSQKTSKGHGEIAAACTTCLKTVQTLRRKKASMIPELKSISRHQRDYRIENLIWVLGKVVENTNRISECMCICNTLEGWFDFGNGSCASKSISYIWAQMQRRFGWFILREFSEAIWQDP